MMTNTTTQLRSQAGFGIIEIMIALLLGIIIMLGVTEIATNNSNTRHEVERAARLIDNAAYALRMMEGDLTNAAYWGERREVEADPTPPPICPDIVSELEDILGYPLQGGRATVALNVACATDDGSITPKVGTNYLAIRRASSCALGSDGCDAAGTNFHLQVNACFDQDNPQDTERVEITNVVADLDSTARNCSDLAPVYRLMNRIYYVNGADQLVRAELVGAAYEEEVLIEDVEMLRFEYGLDTSQDGQEDLPADLTDPYPDIPNDIRWADVVRVKISLVVRSREASSGFTDGKAYTVAGEAYTVPADMLNFRRQLYTRTVSLRNVAGRRE
jgi:type IV pilus assembly protein PilW